MKISVMDGQNIKTIIESAVAAIKSGGLVVFPSDTVYGLLADARNPQAVNKLVRLKNRPTGKAISVFVNNMAMMEEYALISKQQKKTLERLLPGSYTVVLKSRGKVAGDLEAENGTLGLRYAKYDPVNAIVSAVGGPVTATSANLSGRPPTHMLESFLNSLPAGKKDLIDLAVDAGKLPRRLPSTVIDLTESELKILRLGGVVDKTRISASAKETMEIAREIYRDISAKCNKNIIFILQGEPGSGKTVFAKGVGNSLGVGDIISPTYVIYYEYPLEDRKEKLYHFDLYNIREKSEFDELGIIKLLKGGGVFVFEWGEKAGELYPLLRKYGKIVMVKLEYLSESERKITFSSSSFSSSSSPSRKSRQAL